MIAVREDVKDIKADVKTLLASYNQSRGRNAMLRMVPWAALVTAFAALIIR